MPTPSPEQQKRARIVGVLFVLTFITAIGALLLYDPVLNNADYVLGGGSETRVRLGAYLEVFLVITNIGTAVVLWPLLKRQSETLALSYVASRIVESTLIQSPRFSGRRRLASISSSRASRRPRSSTTAVTPE